MDEKTAEKLWMTYFNDVLFEKGLITKENKRNIEREITRIYG